MTFRMGQALALDAGDEKATGKIEGFEKVDGGIVLHVFVNEADRHV